ncbi:MAG TPA: hypothetical protein VF026_28940 [Ktedonobacteraceae bacterium]
MLVLSCFWLLLGLLIGLLAVLAKFWPLSWGRKKWPAMLSIGALAAFCGGWLGTLLLGRFFASSVALWIAVLCVVVLPRLLVWVQQKHRSLFPRGTHSSKQ